MTPLYRAFPWDSASQSGMPFAPDYIPQHQGSGRFDLRDSAVWYLAESPEHAVAEMLQGFRGRRFHEGMLRRFGRTLAFAAIALSDDTAAHIANLDDPRTLLEHGISPSTLASDDRARTQAVAESLFAGDATGLRWWSRLSGDWHSVVLFLERAMPSGLAIGNPVLLTGDHPAVLSACRYLGVW
ncbi:MAG: RES family NAD+ phosphorylase [bacterium]